jgi:hypothetical protein
MNKSTVEQSNCSESWKKPVMHTCCIFSKSRHGLCKLCGLGVLDRCLLFGDGVDVLLNSEAADDEVVTSELNCRRISSSSEAAAALEAAT